MHRWVDQVGRWHVVDAKRKMYSSQFSRNSSKHTKYWAKEEQKALFTPGPAMGSEVLKGHCWDPSGEVFITCKWARSGKTRPILLRKHLSKEVTSGTWRKWCTGVIILSQPALRSIYFKSGSLLRALCIRFHVSDRDRMWTQRVWFKGYTLNEYTTKLGWKRNRNMSEAGRANKDKDGNNKSWTRSSRELALTGVEKQRVEDKRNTDA